MGVTLAYKDGDYWIKNNGQLMEISGISKADQDLAECQLTEYIPEEDYGTEVFSLIGDIYSVEAMQGVVSQKVRDVVTRFQSHQQADPELTDDEEIDRISRLDVFPRSPNNLGDICYILEVETMSGGTVGTNDVFMVSIKQSEPSKETLKDLNLVASPNRSILDPDQTSLYLSPAQQALGPRLVDTPRAPDPAPFGFSRNRFPL